MSLWYIYSSYTLATHCTPCAPHAFLLNQSCMHASYSATQTHLITAKHYYSYLQRAFQGIVLLLSIFAFSVHLYFYCPSFRMHVYFQSIFRIQNFQHSESVHLFSMCIFSQISYSESAHALNYSASSARPGCGWGTVLR